MLYESVCDVNFEIETIKSVSLEHTSQNKSRMKLLEVIIRPIYLIEPLRTKKMINYCPKKVIFKSNSIERLPLCK